MPESTTTIFARQREPITASGGPAEESQANEISAQATGWQNVVRHARESCQQGLDAVEELHRRRNKSGQ
jgi:hypothetical protein